LKKLSISIKTGVIKHYGVCLVSFQIVDQIRPQSSWASCELCSHRRRRRDKTVPSCRRTRCVLGIKCDFTMRGLDYGATECSDSRLPTTFVWYNHL